MASLATISTSVSEVVEVDAASVTIDPTSTSVNHTVSPDTFYGPGAVNERPLIRHKSRAVPPGTPAPPPPVPTTATTSVVAANFKDRELASKLHPQILDAYECWQNHEKTSETAANCKIVDGKLLVELVISGQDAAMALAATGFEADSQQPVRNRLRGRIAIEKLKTIAALKEVQFIGPAR